MVKGLYKAILKSLSGSFATYVVQFLSLAIYARFFTPEEFGIIASIQIFVTFLIIMTEVTIGPAIINEGVITKSQRDGLFSCTLILAIIVYIILFVFSFAANVLFDGYNYQEIALIIGVGLSFSTLSIVPQTALVKDTKFLHISAVNICSELTAFVFVYYLAIHGFGVIALASKVGVQSLTKFTLFYIISGNSTSGRPVFGSKLSSFKSISDFALSQLGFNFVNYFSRNFDNILVAKYFGMSAIGLYDKAYQLMRYPLLVTTIALSPAIQPVLRSYSDDHNLISFEHEKLTGKLLYFGMIVSVFIYLNSYDVINFIFGSQWLETEELIKIFALMIPVQAVTSCSGSFFQAMGRPNELFKLGCISALFNVSSILCGVYFGRLEYIAIALVLSYSMSYIVTYIILYKLVLISSPIKFFIKQTKVFIRSSMPIIVYASLYKFYLENIIIELDSSFFKLLVSGFLGVIILIFCLFAERFMAKKFASHNP